MNKKYVECAEILQSLLDTAHLLIQMPEYKDIKAIDIIKQCVKAVEEYDNLSPEELLEVEAITDQILEQVERESHMPIKDNRKSTKSKKTLLN